MLCLILISLLVVCVQSNGADFKGRIVGGEETTIENFPHQVSLRQSEQHICGGVIIKWNAIITAAHCVTGATPERLTVVAGATFLSEGGDHIPVDRIFRHPNYSSLHLHNDIAVLELVRNFQHSPSVQPIRIPETEEDIKSGTKVIISGWGSIREYGPARDVLQFTTVTVVSNEECQRNYPRNIIVPSMLCAAEPEGGKDACQGDYGGPLIVGGTVVGISSWGQGCARDGYPGVYSRMSAFYRWINFDLYE